VDAWARSAPQPTTSIPSPATPPADLELRDGLTLLTRASGAEPVEVWYRTRLAVPAGRDPVLLLPRVYVALAAYVDGRRVYALDTYEQARGSSFHLLQLPPGRQVEVTLRVVSRYTQVGLPVTPRLGERATLIQALVAKDAPRTALGLALWTVGLASLLLAATRRERDQWLGVAMFSLAIGGWALFQTGTRQLWLPLPGLWFAVWWMVAPPLSAGVALFVDRVFGPGPRGVLRVLWKTAFALTAVFGLSLTLPPAVFDRVAAVLWVFSRVLGVLGTLIVLAWVGSQVRLNRDARLFMAGGLLAATGVLHDIGVSMHLVRDGLLLADVGYTALVVVLIAIVVRRVRAMEDDLVAHDRSRERYLQERDTLVRDLHDGLGGVVTNVRHLADRGSGDDLDPRRALAHIASLADEGMAELRILMTGFDTLPASYRELAIELRRAGTTMLEPHGIGLQFEMQLPPEALGAPDLVRFAALARVHREALVNVTKHARARTVRVCFGLRGESLVLEIEDDGVGLPATPSRADGTGRGLPSMAARARAAGGTLALEAHSPTGTRVRLTLPAAGAQ
jgi:signal transduction histidine kinase